MKRYQDHNYEGIADKTGKEWAVVAAYDHAEYRSGDVISVHTTYELARRAAKRSGYETFRKIRNLRD